MLLTEMKEISINREDLVGFLSHAEIATISQLLIHPCNGLSFKVICKLTTDAYSDKRVTNRAATKVFNILAEANTHYLKESHRYEHGSIYEYSEAHQAYIFLKKGSRRKFNVLNHYLTGE